MMADMMSDDTVRDTLFTLADDENSHATTLSNLLHEMIGRGMTAGDPAIAEGDPDLFDFQSSSKEEVLEFALQNELSAISLYESQANNAGDPKVAKIFRILSETEREHAAYLRLQLGRLAGDGRQE
jgi:rubrerythrin